MKIKQITTSIRIIYTIEFNATDEVAIKQELDSIQTHRAIISFQKSKG